MRKVIHELLSMDNPEIIYRDAIEERLNLHMQCWDTIRQSAECVEACNRFEKTHELFLTTTSSGTGKSFLCFILMKKHDDNQRNVTRTLN